MKKIAAVVATSLALLASTTSATAAVPAPTLPAATLSREAAENILRGVCLSQGGQWAPDNASFPMLCHVGFRIANWQTVFDARPDLRLVHVMCRAFGSPGIGIGGKGLPPSTGYSFTVSAWWCWPPA